MVHTCFHNFLKFVFKINSVKFIFSGFFLFYRSTENGRNVCNKQYLSTIWFSPASNNQKSHHLWPTFQINFIKIIFECHKNLKSYLSKRQLHFREHFHQFLPQVAWFTIFILANLNKRNKDGWYDKNQPYGTKYPGKISRRRFKSPSHVESYLQVLYYSLALRWIILIKMLRLNNLFLLSLIFYAECPCYNHNKSPHIGCCTFCDLLNLSF